ncbi:secretory protein [Arcticibacter tournemirensis]|uniref:Secretory protein n=1 Tax=Arcticibacter tournemirensis TaxID=699437 RepID=A0A5M9H0Q1_9SPHI|nr:basic secretory protein-like protein [Arcticibacter tournemirensis]KAA8479157.1 secretory protein [Arcticibacter tournemirensis]
MPNNQLMLKNTFTLAFFALFCFAATAQPTSTNTTTAGQTSQRRRVGPHPYTITILNKTKVKLDTVKVDAAFQATYPAFAVADGYRTKREVTMRVIDTAKKFTISAKPGEIVVNSRWIKKKDNINRFQAHLQEALHKNWTSVDTVKQGDYQLVFINKNSNFNPVIQKELIETYFKVFPVLVSTFNDKTTHEVIFVTDTAYKGVAEASGNRILFSTTYMNAHPTDIDIVTHEGMHLVQGYGYGSGPVWLTEGIADFIRYKYGVDNIGSKWSLPAFTAQHNEKKYENSYRITARFFEWIDQKVKPGMIIQLDKELRNHTYNQDTWVRLSGKTIDELWDDYAKNPELTLKYSGKERI